LTTDVTRYANTLSWLKLQQQGNGSWQDDAFTTALAVQALYLSANISLPTAPDKATVRGRTVDAGSAQPLANVRITTSPLSATDLLSDAQGSFVLNGLEEGSYRLTYEADGYLTASQTLNVKAGQLIDLGDIRLNLAPTTSLVRGVVSDANTGLPVAQALVQVTLAGTTTDTLTAVDGSYQLRCRQCQPDDQRQRLPWRQRQCQSGGRQRSRVFCAAAAGFRTHRAAATVWPGAGCHDRTTAGRCAGRAAE